MINGDLKSLGSLWTNLAQNHRYKPYVSTRDITEFEQRLENEGLPFLTTVLPKLGKSLENHWANWGEHWSVASKDAFALNVLFSYSCPDSFATREISLPGLQSKVLIPIFLGKALKCALLGDPVAVDCVRQLSLIFYKYEVDYDDQTVKDFLANFKKVDQDCSFPVLGIANDQRDHAQLIVRTMRRIISRILCNVDPRNIRPSHGGGSTACQTANEDKHHKLRYYPKLDAVYPYSDLFFYSPSHLIDEMDKLENSVESVPEARVCLVPKDSRGPRVISCEPCELMFAQQGIMKLLYDLLDTHYRTAGQFNFADQSINRDMARHGSLHGGWSTLDLSEASDRVSLDLVREVFPPNWVECFEACRSETTRLPDGTVVKLNKFAPMGSSCCFPVEALVFWACAEASAEQCSRWEARSTFVYGDDIIVRSEVFDQTIEGLTSIGLLVNANKSYKAGPFRESCGGDYYQGVDVTPVRVRKALLSQGTGIATNADLANSFIAKFGYETALPLIKVIEDAVGYVYPRSPRSLPCTIRAEATASNDVLFKRRWNKNLQRFEHRISCLVSKVITAHPPNWGELFRKELTRNVPGRGQDSKVTREVSSMVLDSSDETLSSYQHWSKPIDAKLLPGQYAVVHSARRNWTWAWLG